MLEGMNIVRVNPGSQAAITLVLGHVSGVR